MTWNYDLDAAPYDTDLLVSFGDLMNHDCKWGVRIRTGDVDLIVDRTGKPISDAYAWLPYAGNEDELAASFNEPL